MDMYTDLAVAVVRGYIIRNGENGLLTELAKVPFERLSDDDVLKLISFGEETGIKLYRFKRGHEEMPRVKKILGFLHSVQPQSLLDADSCFKVASKSIFAGIIYIIPATTGIPDFCKP